MNQLQTQLPTDTWVAMPWNDYVHTIEDPVYAKAKDYYYKGYMRLEMSPVSFEHGRDHLAIAFAVTLFAIIRNIPVTGLDNTTFRKPGVGGCQPDVAYYVGKRAQVVPDGAGIVNLDRYPPPELAIEVSKTSLLDDLGTKRSLYEELGVAEYWVVDVERAQIIAYAMVDGGSKRISASQVLPGLSLALLEEALRRSRTTTQSEVLAWLTQQFQ